MSIAIMTVQLRQEGDVVVARRRARQIAELLELDLHDRTRFTTAVSEIARNAVVYGGGGRVEFEVTGDKTPQMLVARVVDNGPGIADLQSILDGVYHSTTGMGRGIAGTRRLMDILEIDSAPGKGTTVTICKTLPSRAPLIDRSNIRHVVDQLAQQTLGSPYDELQRQNQELLRALEELNGRQEELKRLNNELEDTNRGVVALYAELDEKAEHLRRADELKSKFLSNMSHELRTPLNSTMALTRLLLDRVDGDLTPEQVKQVTFIRKGTESLIELVNDLLDIAKVEAGKTEVHTADFTVTELFGALRGMLRPLLVNDAVNLLFDEDAIPTLTSDEGKVAQILRNLVSNALKFTEKGEVRVSARYRPEDDTVVFAVSDTGIGIASEHQENIFQEFTQLANRLQGRVKGTGLGLPLSRRLAELLGGALTLESQVGAGSVFSLIIPRRHASASAARTRESWSQERLMEKPRARVLMIDDEAVSHYLIEQNLSSADYALLAMANGAEAIALAAREHPDIILLDLAMPTMTGFEVLEALRANPETDNIPVIIYTSKSLLPSEREWIISHGADILMKDAMNPETLRRMLDKMLNGSTNN